MNKKYLKDVFLNNNIYMNEIQIERFSLFFDMLIEKNKVMNLTSITDEKDVINKHFLDSVLPFFLFCKKYKEKCNDIIDIGTGAGFPGIPLAIMYENKKFTLVDSLNKRINFINECISQLEIKNIITVHGRVEDIAHDHFYRNHFDIAVSRAVASLNILLEYTMPFLKKNGCFISYKSRNADNEIHDAKNAFNILNTQYIDKIGYSLDDNNIERNILIFKLTDIIPNKYPRKAGVPKKRPL